MRTRICLLALCLVTGAANAADNGFYLGGGVGRSDFDIDNALDSKDTSYKAIAGIRLLDSFAVELNYADLGSATAPSGIACVALVGTNCPDTTRVDAKALSAYAVGFIDFPVIDLFAKLGVSRTDAKLTTPAVPTFSTSDKSTDIAWGVGLQAHFVSLGVRAEYERFKIFGDTNVGMASVSFVYTFL